MKYFFNIPIYEPISSHAFREIYTLALRITNKWRNNMQVLGWVLLILGLFAASFTDGGAFTASVFVMGIGGGLLLKSWGFI